MRANSLTKGARVDTFSWYRPSSGLIAVSVEDIEAELQGPKSLSRAPAVPGICTGWMIVRSSPPLLLRVDDRLASGASACRSSDDAAAQTNVVLVEHDGLSGCDCPLRLFERYFALDCVDPLQYAARILLPITRLPGQRDGQRRPLPGRPADLLCE